MVYDINSHTDKPLAVHLKRVILIAKKFFDNPWIDLLASFHDIGKMNPNFQIKLKEGKSIGYSQHSYLSGYSLLCCFNSNRAYFEEKFGITIKDLTPLKLCLAIIVHHHGDLPNMYENFNETEVLELKKFLMVQANELKIAEFLNGLGYTFDTFDLNYKEHYFRSRISDFTQNSDYTKFQQDALNHFMDTQFAFASLIHADKRDAGNNDIFQFESQIEDSIHKLDQALFAKFKVLDGVRNPSELNRLRTMIRIESTENIAQKLLGEQRVFTLTAPTGSGKTFTLLSLAHQIQRQKGRLGIIYALPFLSITDQVQNILQNDLEIDYLPVSSKAQNKEVHRVQQEYEENPTQANLRKLLQQDFAEQTFDHPFIVTTFVQLFETLVSNRNSTLLKLPNFSNRIFLIDEVQALPPRLYIFFSAWLDAFCKKHNSYAILSTATMPKMDFPIRNIPNERKPELLFKHYQVPVELTDPQKYFSEEVFNRYKINLIANESLYINDLANHILKQDKSCLIILNTIGDTKRLYDNLCTVGNVVLLNTLFIPEDRTSKIQEVKDLLNAAKKVILISTQLIEAGVDIDFPIVYRDFCPLPNLIQSAGRCNRNKKQDIGQVYFFQLQKEEGRPSSEIIYKKEASDFLKFCKTAIYDGVQENQILSIQSRFFDHIRDTLSIGEFEKGNGQHTASMIECINKAEFEHLGQFQLINKAEFGEEYRYYIPVNDSDMTYETIVEVMKKSFEAHGYEERRKFKIQIDNGLKLLSNRILNVRLSSGQIAPLFKNNEEYFGIRVLSDLDRYSFETGLDLGTDNLFI